MGSSFLSEVDDTSILRTGALHCYHYPLSSLPASRLLLPRSGLERSDFVPWHQTDLPPLVWHVRCQGMNGPIVDAAQGLSLTQMYGPAARCKKISSNWRRRSCINVSGLRLKHVVLRAIMDISARAF